MMIQTIVTQSNACLLYLGRKFNLLGSDDFDLSLNEQCICQVCSFVPTSDGQPDSFARSIKSLRAPSNGRRLVVLGFRTFAQRLEFFKFSG